MSTLFGRSALLALLLSGLPAAAAEPSDTSSQRVESDLLHKRIDLSGVEIYDRAAKQWRPWQGDDAAQVTVVNLWSRDCPPCLAEFRTFADLFSVRYRLRSDIKVLVVADPGNETTQETVVEFWRHPKVELRPGEPCGGYPLTSGSRRECLLTLPDTDPAWSSNERLRNSLRSYPPLLSRPLTLLVDAKGIVRHVFVGSITQRSTELAMAIDRLRDAVKLAALPAPPKAGSDKRTRTR